MSNSKTEHVINKRSISSGGAIHGPGKVVTAKIMRIEDKQFAALLKKKDRDGNLFIIERPVVEKAAPPAPPAKKSGLWETIKAGFTGDNEPTRIEVIAGVIATLYDNDGNQINAEDFIASGEPSVDALELLLADIPVFEEGISSDERNEGFKLYEANKKQASQ